MNAKLKRLTDGGRLLLDGGLGEELVNRGIDTSTGLWSAQALLSEPDKVVAAHRDFIDAGADVLTTNSYSTTRRRFPDDGDFQRMNRSAGALAQRARAEAERDVAIAGSLPPIFGSYRPELVRPMAELEPLYRAQADILAEYVDLFLCETMSTSGEALAAARAAAATGLPVWVSWTLADDGTGKLRSGETVTQAVEALDGLDVRAVLVNCAIPESVDAALPELARAAAGRPFGAYANAFQPIAPGTGVNDGRELPDARADLGPDAYADFAGGWLDAGARIVGGCCEVGPSHIARLKERFF
ncbi:homocysteine S-methyltransferase [Limimonas halophila]|uniref:Homocysteine S-methyltransferase n=1 Tax=Limimonas halophila TaxID=1082479 RepID=A0A1G7KV90_9PROT|nr:homocysteine S-methyltransferase family protein [Limimonas halophila]SDF41143.1 homocysteine S-methyltransferase [Limimonas halophila]